MFGSYLLVKLLCILFSRSLESGMSPSFLRLESSWTSLVQTSSGTRIINRVFNDRLLTFAYDIHLHLCTHLTTLSLECIHISLSWCLMYHFNFAQVGTSFRTLRVIPFQSGEKLILRGSFNTHSQTLILVIVDYERILIYLLWTHVVDLIEIVTCFIQTTCCSLSSYLRHDFLHKHSFLMIISLF